MKRTLALLAAIGLVAFAMPSDATADTVEGTYAIKGKKGKRAYKGTLTLIEANGLIFGLRVVGGKAVRVIGFKQGNDMVVVHGRAAGVVSFKSTSKGFEGFWTAIGTDGAVGRENGVGNEGFEGDYKISGVNPDGKTRYTGTLNIDSENDTYDLLWKVGTSTYRGTAIIDDDIDNLIGAFGNKKNIIKYQVDGDGLIGLGHGMIEKLEPAGAVVQVKQFAAVVCGCKGKKCAKGGYAALKNMFGRLRKVPATKKQLASIEANAKKGMMCLVKLGITRQQITDAVK